MTPERTKELAMLSAAGALECPEAAEWARLLSEGDALAWSELATAREALTQTLVATSPSRTPRPSLKGEIFARIGHTPSQPSPSSKPAPVSAPHALRTQRKGEGHWLPLPIPGVKVKLLSKDSERNYAWIYAEISPGVVYPSHHHSAAEELYILSGDLVVAGASLTAGDFHHAEAHTDHTDIHSVHGCTALMLVPLDALH